MTGTAHTFPEYTPRLLEITKGMKEVTKAQFFEFIGNRDVNPKADASSFKFRHHWSEWRLRSGKLVGVSYGDSYASEPTRFFRSTT